MIETDIRPATLEDNRLMIRWVNSDDSLKWKKSSKAIISSVEHYEWLRNRLAEKATQISIIMLNGMPSGQVRLEKRDEFVLVDIYVIADARRDGVASFALNRSINTYTNIFGSCVFCAIIHLDNNASQKLFLKNGFKQDEVESVVWLKFFRVVE